MQSFAVILASIAALAATAQAYLIWNSANSSDGADDFTVLNNSYRYSACRTLLAASARLARFSDSADEILLNAANAYLADEGLEGGEDGAADNADALHQAQNSFASLVDGELSGVIDLVDREYIYFSDDELAALGYDLWWSFPHKHGFYAAYSSILSTIEWDEDEFSALLESVRQAGAQHDSIKEVCTPILLGGSS